jgi:N-acetylglutamate synthase-like GNAT family acetyltransferase
MVSIAKAKRKDADEILALQKLAYQSEAELYNDWQLPALTQSLDSLRNEFSNTIILKAVINAKIIGSVRAAAGNDCYKIGRLIVHPDYQKKGIGTALLEKIESMNISSKVFQLFTGSKSLSNIRFYEKSGYKITYTNSLTNKVELVFMEKYNPNPLMGWHDLDPGAIYRQFFHPFKANH